MRAIVYPLLGIRGLARFAFMVFVLIGVGLMVDSSLAYLEYGDAHPFVLEKLPLWSEEAFLWALYVHVPSALLSLPACLVLLSRAVRRKAPRFHRWLGRLTGIVILCWAVPSGAVLAFSATGGLVSCLGFLVTAGITAYAMVQSVRAARGRDFRSHRRYSFHVTAQLSVAVTSRFALMACAAAGCDPIVSYIAALWLPVIGSALVVEALASGRSLRFLRGASTSAPRLKSNPT